MKNQTAALSLSFSLFAAARLRQFDTNATMVTKDKQVYPWSSFKSLAGSGDSRQQLVPMPAPG